MKNRTTWFWLLVAAVPLLGVGGWAGWSLKADTYHDATTRTEAFSQTEPQSPAEAKAPFDCCLDPTCPPGCSPACPPNCEPGGTLKCPPCPRCP